MITAGHHSHRKAAGIEIGVQAGTPPFHNFDMESDDTDPDDVDVLAPVTEYVAPAPAVVCDEPATVIEYISPAPVIECVAPAPAVTFVVPSQQLPPFCTTTTVTTDDNLDMISFPALQWSLILSPCTTKSFRNRFLQVR